MSKGHFGVLAFLLAVLVGLQLTPLLRGPPRTSWDYRIDAFKDEDIVRRLNELGISGWEVVSARRAMSDGSGLYELLLRRPQ